uniref:Uncharacterized protein n=1 Tax=Arion vulgaris TaxID=1028688 RepID=A0A0B7ASD6_9EUPU
MHYIVRRTLDMDYIVETGYGFYCEDIGNGLYCDEDIGYVFYSEEDMDSILRTLDMNN